MVFSSAVFMFIFLPITLLAYYVVPVRWQNPILFISGLIFYGWGEPVYVFLMLFSITIDYFAGRLIDRYRGDKRAKTTLVIAVIINIALLGIFKYSDFVVANINAVLGTSIGQPNLPLPIGISFYTFQAMSYFIDVYRGDANMQKDIVSFGAYVTMFPQLIAGPIVKYKDVDEQLRHREYGLEKFSDGVGIFVIGLTKKVLLANSIGMLWDTYSAASSLSVFGSWLGMAAYTFQIYFDFSGYSDMAVGLGKMLGFEFMRNFEYPYVSRSATEFWRRWHISLSTWFREYVYIPLGGNRCSRPRWLFNIFVVWAVTGIWHGAEWNFVIWGLYFAVLLVLERLFLLRFFEKLPSFVSRIYLLFIVVVGWALFAPADIAASGEILSAMFGAGASGLANPADWYYLRSYLPLFFVLALSCLPYWKGRFLRLPEKARSALSTLLVVIGLVLCTASIVDSTYNPFLYFRF